MEQDPQVFNYLLAMWNEIVFAPVEPEPVVDTSNVIYLSDYLGRKRDTK